MSILRRSSSLKTLSFRQRLRKKSLLKDKKLTKKIYSLTIITLILTLFSACVSNKTETESQILTAAYRENLLLGCAVNTDLLGDPTYDRTLQENFNFLTPENVMKWKALRPSRDTYDFTEADKLMDFAEENNMQVRGHTLVWHFDNPDWLESGNFTKEEYKAILKDHIYTVVGRYKGRIKIWDVVNEAIDGSDYRKTLWYEKIGPEYIKLAFKWANEADPKALLSYNDYGVGEIAPKSDRMLELVEDLRAKGITVDGVGFQMHMDITYNYDFESLFHNIKRFTDRGFLVDFTEIDIRYRGEPTEELETKQARYYQQLMEIMLHFDFANVFTVWGASDKYSWIPMFFDGYGNAHLFDDDYNKKPGFFAVEEALLAGSVDLPYDDVIDINSRHMQPSFKALYTESTPVIDGDPSDKEWQTGITYPFAYNQLSASILNITESYEDSFGEWTILYNGNTIYGKVIRNDDITVTTESSTWENDNVEVFFFFGETWAQLRTIVGADFEPHSYVGNQKAVWSEDGTVVEFKLELPMDDLTGLRSGWNIALSDNDGNGNRDGQFYVINGINNSWQGKGFGNIQFIGDSPRPPQEPYFIMPYMAVKAKDGIIIDGIKDTDEWKGITTYGLTYNQLKPGNQIPNRDYKDFSGTFGLKHKSGMLYGVIERLDDNITANDTVEVALAYGDSKKYFSTQTTPEVFSISSDGSVVEFGIDMSDIENQKIIGFNIALGDDDGSGLEFKQYPQPGEDKISQIIELGELELLR